MQNILKKIKVRDLIDIIKLILSIVPALIYQIFLNRELWLVSERENEAKDNGFWFYKYACENINENVDVYYAIKKKSNDYDKLRKIGKTVEFGSLKHYILTLCSNKYISSQYSNGLPGRVVYYFWIYGLIKLNFYFLQHGVTMNQSDYLKEPAKKVKFFCCVSEKEADFAKKTLGYSNSAAKVLGFCRYDGLKNKDSNTIFIMFTWRKYLSEVSAEFFKNTTFYKSIQFLLNDENFNECVKEYKISFVLHPGIAKYQHLFVTRAKNIRFIDINDISFQEQISSANIFITDYSSVSFDFAYLNKSVIYYQFDKTEFRDKHLQEGYFDYSRDGFGPVCEDVKSVVEALKNVDKNIVKYRYNRNEFFKYRDYHNCKRIFEFICNN